MSDPRTTDPATADLFTRKELAFQAFAEAMDDPHCEPGRLARAAREFNALSRQWMKLMLDLAVARAKSGEQGTGTSGG